jgi:Tfp pilus assembly protein PilV
MNQFILLSWISARRRFCCRRGFSLVETVIACTIILLVLAGSYMILDSSMGLVRTARDGYTATTISNARLERARMVPFADIPSLVETNTIVDDYGLPSTDGRFRRTTTISTNQPMAGCSQVTVTTDVRKAGKPTQFYNTRVMRGVFTPYDMPP